MITKSHTVVASPPLENAERIPLEFITVFSGQEEITGSNEMSFRPLLWLSSNESVDRELEHVFIPTCNFTTTLQQR
jgi:hypothetical protein